MRIKVIVDLELESLGSRLLLEDIGGEGFATGLEVRYIYAIHILRAAR